MSAEIERRVRCGCCGAFPPLELGRVVMTRGVSGWVEEDPGRLDAIARVLLKHQRGNWGEVSGDDARANDEAILTGDRFLSAWTLEGQMIWLLTEGDRSVTTMLFPEEY